MSTASASAGACAVTAGACAVTAGACAKNKFPLVRFTGNVKSICGCTSGGCRLCYHWLQAEADARYRLAKKERIALDEAKASSASDGKIKFTDLYEDIVLNIGEYLDLESSIALFLAVHTETEYVPAVSATRKITLRKLAAINPGGLAHIKSINLLIFLGKISEKDLRNIGSLVSFATIIEKLSDYNLLLNYALADHTTLFQEPGLIKQSKDLHKQYGHVRQNKYLVEELHSAWLELAVKTQSDLDKYYYAVFNIVRADLDDGGDVLDRLIANCFDDPLARLGALCERIPIKNVVRLTDTIYESIFKFTHYNFRDKKEQRKSMKKYFSLIEAMDSIRTYISKFTSNDEYDQFLLGIQGIPEERILGITVWNLPFAERRTYIRNHWPQYLNVGALAYENAKWRIFAQRHYILVNEDWLMIQP